MLIRSFTGLEVERAVSESPRSKVYEFSMDAASGLKHRSGCGRQLSLDSFVKFWRSRSKGNISDGGKT